MITIRLTCIFLCLHIGLLSFAQSKGSIANDTSAAAKFLRDWEKNFLETGIAIDKDSFRINDEAKKLLLDSQYRKNTYPAKYNWPEAIQLMNKMELKKAFWHLINIYR